MIKHLPLCNFQKSLHPWERELPLTSGLLSLTSPDFGERRLVVAAARENLCYRWGTLFPSAHVVISLICLWVEMGKGEGSVQSLATEKSHEVIGAQGFPCGPLAAIVFLACIPRGSPPLPRRALILEFLLWTYILFHLKICPNSQIGDIFV